MSVTYDPGPVDGEFEAFDEGDPTHIDDDDFSVEEQARARGWKAPGEPGAPANAISAEEFMARGTDPRIMREENRRLGGQVARLNRRLDKMAEDNALTQAEHLEQLRQMRAMLQRGETREINAKRAELTEARSAAVENGDRASFEQIDQQLAALQPPPPEPDPTPAPRPKLPPAEQAAVDDFVAANPWFTQDEGLRQTIMVMHSQIRRDKPGMPLPQQLELAKRRLIAAFPEKFGVAEIDGDEILPEPTAPARRPVNTVARPGAGSTRPAPAQRGSIWDQIPADERQIARDAYKTGLRSDPDQPEGEFIAMWLDPHLDVLELRRKRPKK
jgi:hypothetical protein